MQHARSIPVVAIAGLIGASIVAGGCGRPPGELFESTGPPLQWPPPPDRVRIEYLGQLVTSDDLKPGRSAWQGLGEALFGRQPARSMLSPYALCLDGADRLLVCDSNAQLVHVFDLEQRVYAEWKPGPDGPAFAQPVGIAVDRAGRALVSDSVAGTIFVFDPDGAFLGEMASEHLLRPCGLAADRLTDRLFVADAGAHQVVVLDHEGNLLGRVGSRGTEPGQFNYPTNVAVDDAGRLYVTDALNFRVQVFDRDLRPLRQVGRQGDLPGYFSCPKGVAVDADGNLYVVDAHFEAVQIFDDEGRLLLSFAGEGSGPGEFWLPAGIHIDLQNRIWIADSYNRRVQVFTYRPEQVEP